MYFGRKNFKWGKFFFEKIFMIFDDVEKKIFFKRGLFFKIKGGYFSRNYLPL